MCSPSALRRDFFCRQLRGKNDKSSRNHPFTKKLKERPIRQDNCTHDPLLISMGEKKEAGADYLRQRIAFNSEVVDTSVQDLST